MHQPHTGQRHPLITQYARELALARANAARAMQEIESHLGVSETSAHLNNARDALKAILDN